jgi:hypothetical protein
MKPPPFRSLNGINAGLIVDKAGYSGAFRLRGGMTNIEMYRANAAAQRAAAAATNLPNRREMHERSAQSWDAMADSAEDTLRRTGVNEAAKAQLAAASA